MDGRSLTPHEIAALRPVFGDSLDLSPIRVTRDHPLAFYAPKTLGNTIHLRSDWGLFAGTGLGLSERGMSVLVHELVHAWQYQNGGLGYITGSLLAQHAAWRRGGERSGAYRWRPAADAGLAWSQWNPEQQAQAIQDWWDARVRLDRDDPRSSDPALVERAAPYLRQLRAGEGAPRLSRLWSAG